MCVSYILFPLVSTTLEVHHRGKDSKDSGVNLSLQRSAPLKSAEGL